MENSVIAPTHAHNRDELSSLVAQAKAADEADQRLTIKEALKHYKKAVFWATILSTSLVMEGYDLVIINSFYGLGQFQERFGKPVPGKPGTFAITASWQSGLSNSSVVGQLVGLLINSYTQDRFGCRPTMMFFMCWLICTIFITFFAPSLPVLAVGEALCGIPWGVFQTLSTTYASEVVPTVLRPYVTAYVCMCWGAGILLSSGVVRATSTIAGNIAWRLPFALQWMWPVPLFFAAYFAPESPWNSVRRGKIDTARQSLNRLMPDGPDKAQRIEAKIAYLQYTNEIEKAETEGARFIDCFKGINARRTEINCVVWAAQILCGNALLGFSVVFLEAAGFSTTAALDINISLSACYIIGGVICFFIFPHFGRATIYMTGLAVMFAFLIVIGGLGFASSNEAKTAIAILFVLTTLVNMISVGPVCYPIVAETPSGRLRYKTVSIGRFVYNLTGIFQNSLTPRMVNSGNGAWGWGAKTALFYAGTNLACNIWCWFRLPETKDRSFGEIDIMFDNRVPARKFKYTRVDQFAIETSEASSEAGDHTKEKDGAFVTERVSL